ncbi:SH2 domain containing 3Cb [Neosynchiropus ocellatus]
METGDSALPREFASAEFNTGPLLFHVCDVIDPVISEARASGHRQQRSHVFPAGAIYWSGEVAGHDPNQKRSRDEMVTAACRAPAAALRGALSVVRSGSKRVHRKWSEGGERDHATLHHASPLRRRIMNRKKASLRWFGSLTNLSSRHNKSTPEHDGSCDGGRSAEDGAPGRLVYARSSSMHSHVGTVPRTGERRGGRDHVPDSPLLSALSALSPSSSPRSAAARPLPDTPSLKPASPLTFQPDSCSTDRWGRNGPAGDPSGMSGSAVSQDVYVPMDSITHADKTPTRDVAPANRPRDVMDGGGEYVKFSREKFWLEPPTETLRKQLEEELKLSGSNLRSHAWYHGCIPWEVSESLVLAPGDFLLRDSESSQGDFVLTCHWDQKTNHFLVRRTVVQSGETYSRVQFSLEDEAFDSLPALVHFYVGSKAVLTRWSGARIHRPVNRTLPLSYLETAFPSGQETAGRSSPASSLPRVDPTPADSYVYPAPCNSPRSTSPRSSRAASSDPSPGSTLLRPALDQDGTCYTELCPSPQSYVQRLQVEDGAVELQLRAPEGNVYFSPVVETASSFSPRSYRSVLMPEENKPLEVGILKRVKELLAEVEPRTAAEHITKCDCTVARILDVTSEVQKMMGVSSGMELLTLPHGRQLRLDLLERYQTMAITLAVDVLGCTGTTEERAALLHKVICIAAELKSSMGNLFGFAAVMRALELPQVTRLEQTWAALRQRHTDAAVLYEKTLRPFMKSLNEGRENCPLSSTCFPHVLPLLALLERSVAVGEGAEPWETLDAGVDVVMFHLGAARTVAQLGGVYRTNAENRLQGFQNRSDISEVFNTDFQMRLLWGSKGAAETQVLRFAKFDQVLTALSNRLEPPARSR